jgi:hypothetical protein
MAYLYSPVLVDSTSALKWRFQIIEQSATSKLTDTVRESLSLECTTEGLTPRLSGTTLPHSTGDRGMDEWILSLAGSPAKIYPVPGKARGLSMGIGLDCGLNTRESFATYDQDLHLWKTSQESFLIIEGEISGELLGTWPSWGMIRNGAASRRPVLVRHLREREFSYWPRMCTTEEEERIETVMARKEKTRAYGHQSGLIKLGTAVKMWARLIADDCVTKQVQELGNLESWLRDGSLTPQFGCWLMGFKTGWTELNVSEMQWFRSKPRKLGKSSVKGNDNATR